MEARVVTSSSVPAAVRRRRRFLAEKLAGKMLTANTCGGGGGGSFWSPLVALIVVFCALALIICDTAFLILFWRNYENLQTFGLSIDSSFRRQIVTDPHNVLAFFKRLNHLQRFQSDPTKKVIERLSRYDKNHTTLSVSKSQGADIGKLTGKDRVLYILQNQAGLKNLDLETVERLPTWEQVVAQYGSIPILVKGHDGRACERFQASVPAERRMLGSAGMFSSGTNLVTQLLKQNCQIPERVALYGEKATKEQHGMRWQVPWGKHTDVGTSTNFRDAHLTDQAAAKGIDRNDILPVVTIRDPWRWMSSMCRHPYSAKWRHNQSNCPHLQLKDGNFSTDHWNSVRVKYGAGFKTYESLAHLWNDWYNSYVKQATSYPWVMIRMEDVVFHTKDTITAVCECVGGRIRTDQPFVFVIESAKKDSPGHDTSTGLAEAWIKYSQPLAAMGGFSEEDYTAAVEAIDENLMETFQYQHPNM